MAAGGASLAEPPAHGRHPGGAYPVGVRRTVSTTVVAVVGDDPRPAAAALGEAANVRAALVDRDTDPLERAVEAWRAASRTHRPYLVHDADPLAAVAAAWVARYDDAQPPGGLEVAVSETLARWRAGTLELPDYYLVVDPQDLPVTRRHWLLGYLHDRAPARVVPVGSAPQELLTAVGRLRAGRWWPDLDALLDGVERVVPDRFARPAAAGPALDQDRAAVPHPPGREVAP